MLDFNISMDAHDWDNDIHLSFRIKPALSMFQKFPEYLLMEIDRARASLENEYKKSLIEKQKHLKIVK